MRSRETLLRQHRFRTEERRRQVAEIDGITEVVEGLEDVSTYPALFAELARRGWSDSDLSKLAGENFLRVFARAEAVAKRLRRTH